MNQAKDFRPHRETRSSGSSDYRRYRAAIPSPIITGSRRYAIPIASPYMKQSRSLTKFNMYDRSSFDKQIVLFSYDSGIDNAKCLYTIDNQI
ncbi:hypothetical protein PsorP6_006149 [Peronosclerospora sorghi]|uniref:Uncharacterized protein n=1 Tax=Peronosclerospora sorghi TaxID=230839 RepID=A0ACC0W292_9STRA|nr:hypothetical protein PsorP6_006149 [Peronosclerospora sorghi]